MNTQRMMSDYKCGGTVAKASSALLLSSTTWEKEIKLNTNLEGKRYEKLPHADHGAPGRFAYGSLG